jgi:hypothetical protein
MAAGRWLLAQVSSVGLTAILTRPS